MDGSKKRLINERFISIYEFTDRTHENWLQAFDLVISRERERLFYRTMSFMYHFIIVKLIVCNLTEWEQPIRFVVNRNTRRCYVCILEMQNKSTLGIVMVYSAIHFITS